MQCLDTDWKMLLDIDEFINLRIDEKKLDKHYTYGTYNHHLFGNINTEIQFIFPDYYWRLHHSDHRILNDGGSVDGRRRWHFRPLERIIYAPILWTLRHAGIRRLLTEPLNGVEIL